MGDSFLANELLMTETKLRAERVAKFLREKMDQSGFEGRNPSVFVICGSGLGGVADGLRRALVLPYEEIPEFPTSSVQGHAGELVIGELSSQQKVGNNNVINNNNNNNIKGENPLVICMKGRFHTFEGYSTLDVSLPVRVFSLLGAKCLVVTNAAGALNASYEVGDFVVLDGHVNMPGFAGGNFPFSDFFGEEKKSLDDKKYYDEELQQLAHQVAQDLQLQHKARRRGVYCFVSGPTFETPTECRFLRMLGGDAVGMSSVPEVLVATEEGMRVVAMSLITNKVVFPEDEDMPDVEHEQVLAAANGAIGCVRSY